MFYNITASGPSPLNCIPQPSNDTPGAAETWAYQRTAAGLRAALVASRQSFTDVGGGVDFKRMPL